MLCLLLISVALAFEWQDIPHWGSFESVLQHYVPTWFDKDRVQKCICNKHVVLLGDSSGTEYAEMLLLVLDGGWSNKSDLYHFVRRFVTSRTWGNTIEMKSTVVSLFPDHRRLRATWDNGSGCKGSFFHRFAGHWDTSKNGLGYMTFSSKTFREEIESDLQKADILILTIDHHTNGQHTLDDVVGNMTDFFQFAVRGDVAQAKAYVSNGNLNVVDRGTEIAASRFGFNIASEAPIRGAFMQTGLCTQNSCFGQGKDDPNSLMTHIGTISYGYHGGPTLALSSILTQALLNKICL
jgi:hypothetical protein